ncbi:hypothetical protein NW767_014613 [Fusarium falciforme]|nr:hypothetical protein NW767_014613 [Fusarium falciforme]
MVRSSTVTLQALNEDEDDKIRVTKPDLENHLEEIAPMSPYDATPVRERHGGSEVDEDTDVEAEADKSGEEKVSSAVFLPHQEMAEARGSKGEGIGAGYAPRPRSLSQSQTPPWLVKDDGPVFELYRVQSCEGHSTPTPSIDDEGFEDNTYSEAKDNNSGSLPNNSFDGQQNDGSERGTSAWDHVSNADVPRGRAMNLVEETIEPFEGYDSDIYDLESIMSDAPSLTSSLSSVEPIHCTAVTDLKGLLLRHEELEPLYSIAISRVGPERFQKNLRHLLLRYGKALRKEAVNTSQDQAARLVRSASLRIAFEIKEAILHDADPKESPKTRREELNDFLRKQERRVEDLSSSGDESLDGRDTDNLQTLESVKNFMISADAFVKLCGEFKRWLNIDDGLKENTEHRNACQAEAERKSESQKRLVAVRSPLSALEAVQECSVAQQESTFSPRNSQQESLDMKQRTAKPPCPRPHSWVESALRNLKHVRNVLSDFAQTRVAKGVARISWTCRCGKRLRIEVPRSQQATGLSFACQAAGPSGASSVSVEISDDASSSTSSTTQASTGASSSLSSNGPPPSSPSAPSTDSNELPDPFIPAGTKKYMLLCVNTGMRLIKLANVDVTDVADAEEMFRRLRMAYYQLRGPRRRNPLVKPKSMHYVKFQLLSLLKSKECIGNYQINSIPSRKEIFRQEYAFRPCPPLLGDLPMPPAIFMHSFLNPGDHLGPMAVEMLPKKLQRALEWDHDAANGSAFNIPCGWGFYIVEEFDWIRIAWCVVVAAVVLSLFAVLWCVLVQDVQGGVGIGQYCIGLLTVGVSVVLLVGHGSGSGTE